MYIYICVCMYVCVYICVYVCVRIYVCMYVCISLFNRMQYKSKLGLVITIRKCWTVKILNKIKIQNTIYEKFKSGKNYGEWLL